MYVGSKQKCLLDSNVLVTIYGYCSMFNPPIFGLVMKPWICDTIGYDVVMHRANIGIIGDLEPKT